MEATKPHWNPNVPNWLCMSGVASATFVFLSGVSITNKIVVRRSTENFSVVPSLMIMLGCLISAWYGVLFSTPDNVPVPFYNGIGTISNCINVFIFMTYARSMRERLKILALLALELLAFAILALYPLLALEGDERTDFCTNVASIMLLCMLMSPLSHVQTYPFTMRFVPQYVAMSLVFYNRWMQFFQRHVNEHLNGDYHFRVVVFPMDLNAYWA